MATHTRRVKSSLFDDRIDILNRNAIEASPAKRVFGTVISILALVRDNMMDHEGSVQLSEYCFNVCDALKTTIQGKRADELSEPVRMTLVDLDRVICGIERTLRRGANIPHMEYDKDKVEEHKLEIQKLLGVLKAPKSPLDETLGVGKRTSRHDPATTSASESARERLIKRAFALHELPSLIEAIFSGNDTDDTIRCLLGEDAQTFIDVMDEALDMPELSPQIRKRCLKSLYRICGRRALLPRALKIPICYDRTGIALYRGGFADVWKGIHCGRAVAVKVVRTYSNDDLQKIIGRFCKEVVTWKTLRHPNVLPLIGVTMSETQFAMISDWMVHGNINDFVKAHPDVNRLELLEDVTRGLIYIHSRGMIHGDLKGANILIDQTGHARLADFGLLTIMKDPTNLLTSSSYTQGGTARWMSPELIAPQRFGLKSSRPTEASDCYALGMVVYETISGKLPFHEDADLTVFVKVLEGERPLRGARFRNDLWRMLEQCWKSQPSDRPTIEDVLRCLEMLSNLSEPPSPETDEGMVTDGGDWDSTHGSSGISNGTSDASTTTSFNSSYVADRPPSPTPVSISRVDSNGGGTYQDPFTVSEVIGVAERPSPDTQAPNVYRSSSTQDSLQALEASPIPASDHTTTVDITDVTQGHTRLRPREEAPPPQPAFYNSALAPTTTVNTAVEASEMRGRTDANFACPVPECRSTFTKHVDLKYHMRSHDEEKPFRCKWSGCGKEFARAQDCKRHELLHFDLPPLKLECSGYGMSFQRMDALDKHLRSEEGLDCLKAQEGLQASGHTDFAEFGTEKPVRSVAAYSFLKSPPFPPVWGWGWSDRGV